MIQPGIQTRGAARPIIMFDAVGTLIHPRPDVIEVYFSAGTRFGSTLSKELVRKRFHGAREKYFQVSSEPNIDFDRELVSSDAIEKQLWSDLIGDVFTDLEDSSQLFEYLWHFFSQPGSWSLYEDVANCWSALRSCGFKIGIASNFDSRLLAVCQELDPVHTADWIFCSAQVGFLKPDAAFFRTIESQVVDHKADARPKIIMVGDNLQNDVLASAEFGWESHWICRTPTACARPHLVSLDQLPALLGI